MVIVGAAIGSPARFLVDQYFKKFTDKPAGTFIVNILGSFLIGLTFATTEHWHDFLAVGFAHLARLKGFDHAVGFRHAAYPFVGFYGHFGKIWRCDVPSTEFYAKDGL